MAIGLKNINGASIVYALKNAAIYRFGYPAILIADNGMQSPELLNFCDMNGIDMSFISVYHPNSNICERVNATAKKILYKLYYDAQQQWDETTLNLTLFTRPI